MYYVNTLLFALVLPPELDDQINRLAFEVAVRLVLLAALGLTRLVMRLRKY